MTFRFLDVGSNKDNLYLKIKEDKQTRSVRIKNQRWRIQEKIWPLKWSHSIRICRPLILRFAGTAKIFEMTLSHALFCSFFFRSEETSESCSWAKKLWKRLKFSTVFLSAMLIIKIVMLFGSVIGAPAWDLVSDYMAAHKHFQ